MNVSSSKCLTLAMTCLVSLGISPENVSALRAPDTSICAQSNSLAFFKETARPDNGGEAAGERVKTDALGNTIVAGYLRGTVNFKQLVAVSSNGVTSCVRGRGLPTEQCALTSNGGGDIFIEKFDVGGAPLWVKKFGGVGDDNVNSLAVDAANGIIIGGGFSNTIDFGSSLPTLTTGMPWDGYVAKLSKDGQALWAKHLGKSTFSNIFVNAVAVDATGAVFVAGSYAAPWVDLGSVDSKGVPILQPARVQDPTRPATDGFINKFSSANGAPLWPLAKTLGGLGGDVVSSMAVDSMGNVIVGGYTYGVSDLSGENWPNLPLLHPQPFAGTSGADSDVFFAKYSGSDGAYRWGHVYGSASPEVVYGLATDAAQNIYIAGSFVAPFDLYDSSVPTPRPAVRITPTIGGAYSSYFAKINGAGVSQWASVVGPQTGGMVIPRNIAADAIGNLAITGIVSGDVIFRDGVVTNGNLNIYATKYDSQGRNIWAHRSSNQGSNSARGITFDAFGGVLTTGWIQGPVLIYPLTAASPASNIKSPFLLKVNPPCNVVSDTTATTVPAGLLAY